MGVEPWYTSQGVAGLPQVNFLGPFTLTHRLMPHLAGDARIVTVVSVMHRQGWWRLLAGCVPALDRHAMPCLLPPCRFSSLPTDPQRFFTDWEEGGSYRNCKHASTVWTVMLNEQLCKQQAVRGVTHCCVGGTRWPAAAGSLSLPLLLLACRECAQLPWILACLPAGCGGRASGWAGRRAGGVRARCLQHAHTGSIEAASTPKQMVPRATKRVCTHARIHMHARMHVAARSTICNALFAPPDDACAALVHGVAQPDVPGGAYLARGLFAHGVITRVRAAAACCCTRPRHLHHACHERAPARECRAGPAGAAGRSLLLTRLAAAACHARAVGSPGCCRAHCARGRARAQCRGRSRGHEGGCCASPAPAALPHTHPQALRAAHDGRGRALLDVAAGLAGLPAEMRFAYD